MRRSSRRVCSRRSSTRAGLTRFRAALGADERFAVVEADDAGVAPITAVHDPGLVEFLERAWRDYQQLHPGTHDVVPDVFSLPLLREGVGAFPPPSTIDVELGQRCFETTTPLTQGTYDAARSAVDVAVAATDRVLAGERLVYGLCRPPGHHAPRALYGGYCFFNNAAVAAQRAVTAAGAHVVVLDVDYHHGNGTQQIFYARDDVMYVSLHGDPARAYPYVTGHADETGAGRGRGANLNVPMRRGADDDEYLSALAHAIEAIDSFGPALVVVSLGVDTYHADPISDLAVTTGGFNRQGALVAELGVPLVVLQEGGYAVDALGANVSSWLSGASRI